SFNQRKFYSKPTNNNLTTSSTSQSANKKQEFFKTDNKKMEKKDDEKKRDMSRVKCYNYKDEQVLLAKDQAWMESSSDSDQEINATMNLKVNPFSIPTVTMADNRTMKEMLQAPTEGYGDAIFVPDILAENFEIRTDLLSLIQANQFHGFKSNNPHDHIVKFEKRIQKIDHLARSLLIKGLPNDIYSLIDSNKTAKDLWDALARHMLGSEYGEQDRKAAVLYEYETFKAPEGELLLDTYIRYLQYATMMRQNKNLTDINIDSLYNILKQNQGDVNDAMRSKKKTIVVTFDPLASIAEKTRTDNKKVEKKDDEKKKDMSRVKCYNCKKEGRFAKDCKKVKVKDYEYYKTKMLLANKDKDEQVLLAEDHAWMESSSDLDQEINENMVIMAQIENFLFDSEVSSSSVDEKISKVSYYLSESESESGFETSKYYDNSTNY
nr:reverse transcriptase domain-containing protein [Tanacetum cinerariifolium]